MLNTKKCEGRRGPIPLGDELQGEDVLRPFFMLHDYLYLEDECHAPIEETSDSAALALEELEREHDRLQAQQAVVAEKVEAGWVAFRNQRDAIVVHGGSSSLEGDEALRRVYAADVATRLRISERSATNLIEESKTLVNDLPETMDAWRLGWISQQHARAAAHQAWDVPVEARAEFDAAIAPKARTQTASRFRQTARKIRERLHPDSIELRKKEAFAERQVEVCEEPDGMASLCMNHSADVVFAIEDRVRVLAKRRKNETPGEQRTLAQLGSDIVAEALLAQLGLETLRLGAFGETQGSNEGESTGSTVPDRGLSAAQLATMRPGVVITVSAATLLGESDEPAVLNGYGPIDIDTATDLVSQASSFHRMLTNPIDGSTVAIDPTKYRLSEQVKRLIQTRDVTCGFPGCDVRAERCDIDHVEAWEDGGRSSPTNLVCLCRRHHTLKHSTRWRSEVQSDGSLLWTSPTGAKHTVKRGEVDGP